MTTQDAPESADRLDGAGIVHEASKNSDGAAVEVPFLIDLIDEQLAVAESRGRRAGLREALGFGTPWSILSVLNQLSDCADHGHHTHGCDRDGHKLDIEAKHAADEIAHRLRAALDEVG